eukprot:4665876-Amphidinium_carterae.1
MQRSQSSTIRAVPLLMKALGELVSMLYVLQEPCLTYDLIVNPEVCGCRCKCCTCVNKSASSSACQVVSKCQETPEY